jgi:hypothetical protein
MSVTITGKSGSVDSAGSGIAAGVYARAEGKATVASGQYSHAEGTGAQAAGDYSHAEGNNAQAAGLGSHSQGVDTQANSAYSHSEGYGSKANGTAAHAEGFQCTASGSASHAQGNNCYAGADYSHAQGLYSMARHTGSTARSSARFANPGDGQVCGFTAYTITTNATPTPLTFDNNPSASINPSTFGSNVLVIFPSSAVRYRVDLAMRRTDVVGDSGAWTFDGLMFKPASGTANLVTTSPNGPPQQFTGAGNTYAAAVSLATGGGYDYLAITVTGLAAATTRWLASISTVELG